IVFDALLHEQPPAFRRQGKALAHDRKRALAADLLTPKPNRSGMHWNKSGDGIQRRGLAAAVGAKQRDDRALRHLERDVGHADQAAVADFEMLDLEQRRAHVAGPPISSIRVRRALALAR